MQNNLLTPQMGNLQSMIKTIQETNEEERRGAEEERQRAEERSRLLQSKIE